LSEKLPTNIAAITPVAARHTTGFADPACLDLPAVQPIRVNVERRVRTHTSTNSASPNPAAHVAVAFQMRQTPVSR